MIELKKTTSPLFVLAAIVMSLISMMGAWWLYLIFGMSHRLQVLEGTDSGPNILRLILWEGSAFILLLLFIFVFFIVLFYKDTKKNKSIHFFFASLTHELKTPLASIRLQSEVIQDEALKLSNERLGKLSNRLINDSYRLESQLDNILQLSRLERGGNLNLSSINLSGLIENISNLYKDKLTFNFNFLNQEKDYEIFCDQFLIEIVFKNLIENTISHTDSKNIWIELNEVGNYLEMTYKDEGVFTGNLKKLGNLFYKFNSAKGSGIGLYLSKKIIKRIGGRFEIKKENGPSLNFHISFPLNLVGKQNGK